MKLCWEQTKKLLKNLMTGTKFIPTSKVINKTKQQAAMIQLIEHCICNWKIRFKDHCKLKIHYVSGYLKTLIMVPGVCKISQVVQSPPNSFWIVSLHGQVKILSPNQIFKLREQTQVVTAIFYTCSYELCRDWEPHCPLFFFSSHFQQHTIKPKEHD